jgi:hypothetical protein
VGLNSLRALDNLPFRASYGIPGPYLLWEKHFFWTSPHYVIQAGLELMILLPQPP